MMKSIKSSKNKSLWTLEQDTKTKQMLRGKLHSSNINTSVHQNNLCHISNRKPNESIAVWHKEDTLYLMIKYSFKWIPYPITSVIWCQCKWEGIRLKFPVRATSNKMSLREHCTSSLRGYKNMNTEINQLCDHLPFRHN